MRTISKEQIIEHSLKVHLVTLKVKGTVFNFKENTLNCCTFKDTDNQIKYLLAINRVNLIYYKSTFDKIIESFDTKNITLSAWTFDKNKIPQTKEILIKRANNILKEKQIV